MYIVKRKLSIKKIISISALFLVLCSCGGRQDKSNDYVIINNKALEREIISYTNHIDSLIKPPHIFYVYFSNIDRLSSRYVIGYDLTTDHFEMLPYHFICMVNGHEVYFTAKAAIVLAGSKNKNFFINKEENLLKIMKKTFPREYNNYQYYKRTGVQYKELYYDYLPTCSLLFKNDTLIKREINGDLIW